MRLCCERVTTCSLLWSSQIKLNRIRENVTYRYVAHRCFSFLSARDRIRSTSYVADRLTDALDRLVQHSFLYVRSVAVYFFSWIVVGRSAKHGQDQKRQWKWKLYLEYNNMLKPYRSWNVRHSSGSKCRVIRHTGRAFLSCSILFSCFLVVFR